MISDKNLGKIQLILVIIFVVSAVSFSKFLESKKDPKIQSSSQDRLILVEVKKVKPKPYQISFNSNGVIEARDQIQIISQVAGRVVEVNENFFDGGNFNLDEELFKIEPRDFILEVEKLEAEVAKSQTNLDLEKAESKAAKSEWKLINGKKKIPDLVARKPQLAEARASLKSAKANLGNANLALERTSFKLPFMGKVIKSEVSIGQFISAGQSYGEVFDVKSLEIKSSLKEQDLKWLVEAQNPEVEIEISYFGKIKKYKGKLKRKASFFDSQTRFGTVYFGFEDEVKDLLPGVFAKINVKAKKLNNITIIPSSALQKEGIIWIVDDKNILKSHMPQIIYFNDEYIAVKGISKEVKIVTSRIASAIEGMKVLTKEIK